jgi:hypothetical protein
MIKIFAGMRDLEQGPMGIVATQQTHAAGQLAEAAAGTKVKIGFNEKVVGHGHSGCPPTQTESRRFSNE